MLRQENLFSASVTKEAFNFGVSFSLTKGPKQTIDFLFDDPIWKGGGARIERLLCDLFTGGGERDDDVWVGVRYSPSWP